MTLLILPLCAIAALLAYIRFAPSDSARWHIALDPRPAQIATLSQGQVTALVNGAYMDLPAKTDLLAQLDAIALATPRTTRLAGSVVDGHITWITRSALIGYPDYTTAQITQAGITVFARQRFGRGDWGVNAARLAAWLNRLNLS